MKIYSIRFLLFTAIVSFFGACSSSSPSAPDPTTPPNYSEPINNPNNVKVETDRSTLNDLQTLQDELNKAVTFERFDSYEEKYTTFKSADWLREKMEHQYTFVAELASPRMSGEPLSATEVIFDDNRAYITFNRRGDVYEGGVGVINLDDPNNPFYINYLTFDDMDVNGIDIERTDGKQRKLWLACSSKNGGELVEVRVGTGEILEPSYTRIKLSKAITNTTASANSVAVTEDYIYITSGKTYGGLFWFDKETLDFVDVLEFDNAKNVVVDINKGQANKVAALAARPDNSTLYIGNTDGKKSSFKAFSVGRISHQSVDTEFRGKSTMFLDEDDELVWISKAKYGLEAYNISTGAKEFTSPQDLIDKGNVNAVTHDLEYLYLATGQDGLCIAGNDPESTNIQPFALWDKDEDVAASANYIQAYNDEWIFIAKGGGGFKILRKEPLPEEVTQPSVVEYDADGKPLNLEEDRDVCESLGETIKKYLPEQVSVWENNPEWFDVEVREFVLQEEAEIFVSFVNEGAGQKNTLGYYYYDKDNPPTRVEDLKKRIIFPNASKVNHGGSLIPGNTMKVLDKHPAGTVIGFFLVSFGWNGVTTTEGIYTHYTIPELNQGAIQQHLVFYNPECGSTVLSFEDIYKDNSDEDYNDAIFTVSTEPANALNTGEMIIIE